MKKLLSLVLTSILIMSLFGCSNNLEISYVETTKAESKNSVVETAVEETTSGQDLNAAYTQVSTQDNKKETNY